MERKHIYIAICVTVILCLVVAVLLIVFLTGDESSLETKAGRKLVIDHDGGADDAMAIFEALLYEKYFCGPEILALTTSNGNVNESQVFVNTQRILDIAQRRDVPIYRGSSASIVITGASDYWFGMDGLGDSEHVEYTPIPAQDDHAVLTLIDMAKKYEGELTVAVIGPATNVALAIKLDPLFISRLAHLYIAAGNIYSETSEAEFNALIDVEAYHIITENSFQDKVTFIPFSPFTTRFNISMDWRLNVLGDIQTSIIQNLNEFERISNNQTSKWIPLDPMAMAMILNNELFGEEKCTDNSIILCGSERGITVNNFTDCDYSNSRIAYPNDEEAFKTFLYEVFSAELHP